MVKTTYFVLIKRVHRYTFKYIKVTVTCLMSIFHVILTFVFQDINECDPSSGVIHGCQGTCNNLNGSYKCSCPNGHYFASNGRDCTGKMSFSPVLTL